MIVQSAIKTDISAPLVSLRDSGDATQPSDCEAESCGTSPKGPAQDQSDPTPASAPALSPAGMAVEQNSQGRRPSVPLIESFDGLGAGFEKSAGKRFAARLAKDPKGKLTFHETVLANGEAAQTKTLRWEDYTTTAIDPSDDCTFWYVGDYFKVGDTGYRTRIGSFKIPKC